MKISKAREIAATAWCDKKTSNREMDVELAEVFAELLCKIYRQGRVDQNEADVMAVHKSGVGRFDEDIAVRVIRAAGPEEGK